LSRKYKIGEVVLHGHKLTTGIGLVGRETTNLMGTQYSHRCGRLRTIGRVPPSIQLDTPQMQR